MDHLCFFFYFKVVKMKSTDRGKKRTESALLKKLKYISKVSEGAREENEVTGEEAAPSMTNLFEGLKVDTTKAEKPERSPVEGRGGQMEGRRGEKGRGMNEGRSVDRR